MSTKTTQGERLLKHLQTRGSITALQALQLYGIARLDNRIRELRKKGYQITVSHVGRTNCFLEDFKAAQYKLHP